MSTELALMRDMRATLKQHGASDEDAERIAGDTLHKLRVRNLYRRNLGSEPIPYLVAVDAARTMYFRERVAADLTKRKVDRIGQPHRRQQPC